jgi:hypothetical protein
LSTHEPPVNGSHRTAQFQSHVRVGASFQTAEDEDQPITRRELSEFVVEQESQIGGRSDSSGSFDDSREAHFDSSLAGNHPAEVNRASACGTEEPTGECFTLDDSFRSACESEERCLERVLGIGSVAQHAKTNSPHELTVAANKS